MENELIIPKTLQEAILQYSDEDRCLELLMSVRWPEGNPVCPYCGNIEVGFVKSRRLFQCKAKECRKQFSIKIGTYMEDSPLSLSTWMAGMWLITNAKNGISSCEIARALGITQKTAWFMLHRIRLSFGEHLPTDLGGTVEADETFIGGLEKNRHESKRVKAGGGYVGKAVVMGMLERGDANKTSKVRAKHITAPTRQKLHREITQYVQPGSTLHTDALQAYKGLPAEYVHEFVDHAVEYVRDHVHTNGLENFFALLKRMIKGTYVAIDPAHLHSYLDEQTFRYNERKDNDSGRFVKVAGGAYGKRLTWKQLTEPSAFSFKAL